MIAVLGSALAHALAIVALAGSYGTLTDDDDSGITVEDELVRIRLGIERSEAQTIDWIGYDEYQRHLAPHEDQSQAQMILGAAQANMPTPPAPEQSATSTALDSVTEKLEKPASTIEELLLDRLFEDIDDPTLFVARDPAKESLEAEEQTESTSNRPAPESDESVTIDDRVGDSDKDADAVSKETDETVTEYLLGKPLVAQGLDIRTVRPVWSIRTMLLARPRNPRVRIHFDRTGKVTLAVIEESSGEPDVDRPLLDAIYQWRAVGDRLLELPEEDPDATIAIALTIKLR